MHAIAKKRSRKLQFTVKEAKKKHEIDATRVKLFTQMHWISFNFRGEQKGKE